MSGDEWEWRQTYNDGVDHDVEAYIVNSPFGNLALLLVLLPRGFKDAPQGIQPLIRLFFNGLLLRLVLRRHGGEHLVPLLAQQLGHPVLELALLPKALLLAIRPALLLAAENDAGHRCEGLVVVGGAELVRGEGVGEGGVEVAQGELGLGEVVVGLHVVGGEGEAGLAVGDDGVPVAELEAGHGAVGVEGWVFRVGDDAGDGVVSFGVEVEVDNGGVCLRFGVEAVGADVVAGLEVAVAFFLEL